MITHKPARETITPLRSDEGECGAVLLNLFAGFIFQKDRQTELYPLYESGLHMRWVGAHACVCVCVLDSCRYQRDRLKTLPHQCSVPEEHNASKSCLSNKEERKDWNDRLRQNRKGSKCLCMEGLRRYGGLRTR